MNGRGASWEPPRLHWSSRALPARDQDQLSDGLKSTDLVSVGRAGRALPATTSLGAHRRSRCVLPPRMCANACSQATLLLVSWQADRCRKNAGRVHVRNELFHQGAQVLVSLLSALSHLPMKHGPFQHLALWPSVAVPALSPTILCAGMLLGSSAASAMMGCVVVDVQTVVVYASAAAIGLEMAFARVHSNG